MNRSDLEYLSNVIMRRAVIQAGKTNDLDPEAFDYMRIAAARFLEQGGLTIHDERVVRDAIKNTADNARRRIPLVIVEPFSKLVAARLQAVVDAEEASKTSAEATAPPDPANPPRTPGPRFGNWERFEKLGAGGQGSAYRAQHVETRRLGALKALHSHPSWTAEERAKALGRFRHELQAIREVHHPCVIAVLDAGLDDPEPWIVTEFMEMGSLATVLTALRGDVWRTLRLARAVAAGLAEAHGVGVIHRDVKPANILLRTFDHAVVGDFGIAHIDDATELTSTGEAVGARWFRPPEADHGRLDKPAASFDVYSLGKVIYVCAVGWGNRGHWPFVRERFREEEANLVTLLRRPDLEAVNRLLDHMIVEDPAGRFQSMDEVIRRIDETLGELFGIGPADQCGVCWEGRYEELSRNEVHWANVRIFEPGKPVGPTVEVCSACGDIRLSMPNRRYAWQQSRGIGRP